MTVTFTPPKTTLIHRSYVINLEKILGDDSKPL